jgi:hypothetical protein
MKALKTKVILSGIVLVFAFIATIGTTFAWFTVSQTATVESMELSITAEDSLLIQVAGYTQSTGDVAAAPTNPEDYQTTLTNQDIIDAGYTDLLTYRLQPVTAIQSYYDGVADSGLGEVGLSQLNILSDPQTKALTATTDVNSVTTGKYIELTFYLFYQGTNNVNIILSNPFINSSATTTANPEDAIRLGMTFDDGSASSDYIFGNTTDFSFGYTNGQDGYVGDGTGTTGNPVYSDSDFNDLLNRGTGNEMVTGLTDADSLVTGVIGDEMVLDFATATASGAEVELFTLAPSTPLTVTVKIFVEGWALNTVDEIIDELIQVGFGFAIKE